MKRLLLALLLGLFLAAARSAAEENAYKVIVNADNPVTQISKTDVAAIFLKKAYRWTDGLTVQPVEQRRSSPLRERFSMEQYGKSASALTLYWNQLIFSGKGIPPPEKATDAEIVAYVKANRGGVGYVATSADVAGVKVLPVKD